MQSKPGLGRGLGALLSSTPVEGDTLMQIRVDQVEANPNQPRKAFDSKALEELSASIRSCDVRGPAFS
jgi:ParB family chromosome partitioning protein